MTHGVILRTASADEIDLLKTMLAQDPDNSIGSVVCGVELLGEHVFIIEYRGDVAGFCTYRSVPDEIFPLFVFTPYRQKGVAAEAMRQLIVLLRSEDRKEVFIEIVNGAEGFWGKVFSGYPVSQFGPGKFRINISVTA